LVFALNRSTVITIVVLLSVLTVAAMAQIGGGGTPAQIWGYRGAVLIVVNGFVLALCIPKVFGIVHRITFAGAWLFPLLDGEWDAEIRSNWPRIRRTFEAARTHGPRFDASSDPLSPEEEAEGLILAKATIRSSLISISMKVEPVSSTRVSRTRFAMPQWRKPDLPELSYVYEQVDPGVIAQHDSRRHSGAGVVSYDPDADVIMGEYWTARSEHLGLNTAGTIRMVRRR
jgi:hypothetical protein